MLVFLSAAAAVVEAVSALLLVGLIQAITAPGSEITLPVVGRLDALFSDSRGDRVMVLAVAASLFFLFRGAFLAAQTYLQQRVSNNAGARIANALLERYLLKDYEWRIQRDSPELIRNITSVPLVTNMVFLPLMIVGSELFMLLGLSVAVFLVAPIQSLVGISFISLLAVGIDRVLKSRVESLGKKGEEINYSIFRNLAQSLGALREMKILGKQEFFLRRFRETRWAQARVQYQHATLNALPRVFLEGVLFSALIMIAFVAGRGDPTTGAYSVLGLFGYAAFRALPSVNKIVASVGLVRFGAAALDNVFEDATSGGVSALRTEPTKRSIFQSSVALENVAYRYPGSRDDALHGISFEVSRGESVGIIGTTGAGKTTLMDVLLGLLPPTEGVIRVDGRPLSEVLSSWHDSIGFVSQDFVLFDASVRDNVAFGLRPEEVDEARLQKALEVAQLDDVVAELRDGAGTSIGEGGMRLSGGQRQRVALARAIYREPEVLFLDEGTSALDAATEMRLMKAIGALRSQMTVVMIAHRINTVRSCDRLILLDRGRIQAIGSYEDLLQNDSSFRALAGQIE